MDERDRIRFWLKVNKTSGCWEWKAARRRGGYGAFYLDGRLHAAHRVAWMITHGPIPDEQFILHTCDNRICVNPEHLFLGDQKDNILDSIKKRRYTATRTTNRRKKLRANKRRIQVRRLYELLGTQQAVADVLYISRERVQQLLKSE